MKQRIITGLGLAAFLAVLLWLPGWCMATATLICISFAVHEEMQALKKAGHHLVNWPTWAAMALSVPLTYFLTQKIMIPLIIAALFAMVVQVMFRKEPLLTDLSMSALPLLTVALPGLALVTLAMIDPYLWRGDPGRMPWHAVEVVMLSITFAVPLAGDFCPVCGQRYRWAEILPGGEPKKDHCRQHRRPGGQYGGCDCHLFFKPVAVQ